MVKLSIVTINFNNGNGLRKTIESVQSQLYKHFEYIVIDAVSKDNSSQVIEQYKSCIDKLICEKDTGIYNAMNKGLNIANGEYVFFLNSGDILYDETVLESLFSKIENQDFFYGDIVIFKDEKELHLKSAEEIYLSKKYQHNLPPHPAFFAKKDLIIDIGGFDESYKIIADVVLITKICLRQNLNYLYLPIKVNIFDNNGVSSVKKNQRFIYKERKRFIKSTLPWYINDLIKIYRPWLSFFRL